MGHQRPRLSTPPHQATRRGLRIVYFNARSIVNKINELRLYTLDTDPDVIAITETWTHSGISNDYLDIANYHIASRHDRRDTINGRGGGLLIYVNKQWKSCEVDIQSQFNQIAKVRIVSQSDSLNLVLVYRSPNSPRSNNEAMIEALAEVNGPSIVLGDFNYPAADWNSLIGCTDSQPLIDFSLDKFWCQAVNFATHKSGNTLDLVFADHGLVNEVWADGYIASSDHNVIVVETNHFIPPTSKSNEVLNYRKADFDGIRRVFQTTDWSSVFTTNDVNECWDNFKYIYNKAVQNFVPSHRLKKKCPPWINQELKKMIRQKRALWKKFKQNPSNENHEEFKSIQKRLKKRIQRAKLNFEKQLAKNSKENPKAFYAYLGNKRSNRTGVGPLQDVNGELVLDDKKQAVLLNDYYASVFEAETPMLPGLHQSCQAPMMETPIINSSVVKEEIQNLKRFGSPGPDKIRNIVLLEAADELSQPLAKIFNLSLESSVVPYDWRSANVTPVHKGGSKKMVSNYRPISLTSTVSKIMESIIRSAIMVHLTIHNLIKSTQHGFMKKKSCLTNLLHCMDEITKILDDGDCADILYLDFSKAFDKVQHQRLLKKMQDLNIDRAILSWIKSWLSDRTQQVVLNGEASGSIPVPCSVGQGTVLGPLIFIIFINDIDECVHLLEALILKFADDTKIIKRIKTSTDNLAMQDIINNLSDWASKWQMYFNVNKCKIVHLGRNNPRSPYVMNGVQLATVDFERDLGVFLDSSAKPSLQCAKAATKANQVLGQILRSFQCREKTTLTKLYKTFVRPHLEYAVQAWCPYTVKDIETLEKVQRRFVRQITSLTGTYEEKLSKIGLTTLKARRERGDCIEIFKMMRGLTCVDYKIWFKTLSRPEGPCTRLQADPWALEIQPARLDLRQNSFAIRGPKLWNSLPVEIKQSKSINQFKNAYDSFWQKRSLDP